MREWFHQVPTGSGAPPHADLTRRSLAVPVRAPQRDSRQTSGPRLELRRTCHPREGNLHPDQSYLCSHRAVDLLGWLCSLSPGNPMDRLKSLPNLLAFCAFGILAMWHYWAQPRCSRIGCPVCRGCSYSFSSVDSHWLTLCYRHPCTEAAREAEASRTRSSAPRAERKRRVGDGSEPRA